MSCCDGVGTLEGASANLTVPQATWGVLWLFQVAAAVGAMVSEGQKRFPCCQNLVAKGVRLSTERQKGLRRLTEWTHNTKLQHSSTTPRVVCGLGHADTKIPAIIVAEV